MPRELDRAAEGVSPPTAPRDHAKVRAGHVPALDGLRGIAVLLVLWAHLHDTPGTLHSKIKLLVAPGVAGVDIFFVLSGFLITRILLADKARGMPLKNFLIRRFLRIFPIYYLSIAVLAFAAPGPYLLYCAGYLANFYFAYHPEHLPLHHTWSLAVEEHFYLLWPLVVYRLTVDGARRAALWLIPFALLSGVVLGLLHGYLPTYQLTYMSTMCRAGSLALGATFAFGEAELRGDRRTAWRTAALLAGAAILAIGAHHFTPSASKVLAELVFYASASGLMVLAIIRLPAANPAARVLGSGALPFVGRISYGLYMYHYPIYTAFGLTHEGSDVVISNGTQALAVAGTFATALASYYVIEQPILRFKGHFREARVAPGAAGGDALSAKVAGES